ncbi:DUF2336 domain-containing protein, partial [Aerococcus mictus]|uniref:DUF2336 domain-containing protein n=1 Tax=Aerococcus mictus TaxID=2976810 RepID=UPI002FD6A0B7
DEFLIALIAAQGTSEAKQIAIAERERVSPEVGQALVETENENVVGALLGNARATIAEHSLQKAAADHKDKSNILRLIGERPEATAELARTCRSLLLEDSLDQSMAKEMRAMLTDEHNLPELLAEELTQAALERAIVERISTARDDAGDLPQPVVPRGCGDMGLSGSPRNDAGDARRLVARARTARTGFRRGHHRTDRAHRRQARGAAAVHPARHATMA